MHMKVTLYCMFLFQKKMLDWHRQKCKYLKCFVNLIQPHKKNQSARQDRGVDPNADSTNRQLIKEFIEPTRDTPTEGNKGQTKSQSINNLAGKTKGPKVQTGGKLMAGKSKKVLFLSKKKNLIVVEEPTESSTCAC